MSWDDWRAIEISQRLAEIEDEQRLLRRDRPPQAAPDELQQPQTPPLAYVPPRPLPKPPLADEQRVRGLRALRKYLANTLRGHDDA